MDDVDKRILRVLEADARTSLRKIAEDVGVDVSRDETGSVGGMQ